jgi:hypothetical protein
MPVDQPRKSGERASSAQKTRADKAHQTLRADILNGTYPPGYKLKFEFLQSELGYSASPLREALTRLTADGLVTSEQRRGFTVAVISVAELHDITRLRCMLEPLALRDSMGMTPGKQICYQPSIDCQKLKNASAQNQTFRMMIGPTGTNISTKVCWLPVRQSNSCKFVKVCLSNRNAIVSSQPPDEKRLAINWLNIKNCWMQRLIVMQIRRAS